MEPEIPASSTQIGQDARGVIGQYVIGATVIYGSLTIILGSQAPLSEHTATPAATVGTAAAAPTLAGEAPNPYQGLLAFQPSDSDRFYGRATEIEDLWQGFRALHEQADAIRLLVVYGPSGSGKSSLVRAGLVPELARRPPGGMAQARIALLVPGSQPLQALASVLARIATNDPVPVRKTREFAEELALANGAGEYDGLQRIAALLPEADVWPLVVVVDQLEELYSLCPDASVRKSFLANLLRAAADRSGQVAVVVTLRSDFLGATQADPALNRLIQAQGVFVAALSEQGLREAIRLPAERRGRPLDAATVDLVVEQTLGRDGALPLLSFALLRIWEGLLRGQPAAETLRQIGGVGGALAGEADRIQASLSEGDQRIARRLFLNLVQLGEGSRDTRRRVGLQEVLAHGEDPAATRRVIERFASPAVRLITRSSGQDGRETLELSHEALIEAWPLLRDWLNNSRADLRFQRRLEEAARHWENSSKPEGSLWRPPDLDLLERYRRIHETDLTPRQVAFANSSRLAEEIRKFNEGRRQVFLRGGLVALTGLFLLALGAGGAAIDQLRKAKDAHLLQVEARHRALITSDPFVSIVYGLASAENLLDSYNPWKAAQLNESLEAAHQTNRLVSMPIDTGHGAQISSLIELKNSEIITAGSDGTLRRWRDYKPIGDGKSIFAGQGGVNCLIELANGEVITGGSDGTLRHWRDGKPVGQPIVTGHKGSVIQLIELKNGELISAGWDGTFRRWRNGKAVGLGNPIATGQEAGMHVIEFKNGDLITVGWGGVLRRWRNGKPVGDGKAIATGQLGVSSLIRLKNGELVIGWEDGTLRRWRDGKPVGDGNPIFTGQGGVFSLIELRNGELISGGEDGTLRRWRDGKPVGDRNPIFTGHGAVFKLIELRNGELISGGEDGTLRRWQIGKTVETRNSIATNQELTSLIELRNGQLISGGRDRAISRRGLSGTLRRWRDGKPVGDGKPIFTGQDVVSNLVELKNGVLISIGWDNTVRRWRDGMPAEDGKPIDAYNDVMILIELKNGELISVGRDSKLRRWRDGKLVGNGWPIATGWNNISSLIELENGDLIGGGGDGSLRRWRNGKPVGDGKPIYRYPGGAVTSLIELKNGEVIIVGFGGTFQRWRDGKPVGDGKLIHTGQKSVSLIELKNGELVSGGADGTLRRWRDGKPVGDGRPIATGQGRVISLIELKNGELVSAGSDGTLRSWDLTRLVASVCRSVDLRNGLYPEEMKVSRDAAQRTCRRVGANN